MISASSVKDRLKKQAVKSGKAFLKKKKTLVNVELKEVVSLLKMLLLPIVDSIASGMENSLKWDHISRSWK